MLGTLAFALLIAPPAAHATTVTPFMAQKMALAAQQYGEPKTPPAQAAERQATTRALYMSPTDDIWVYAHAEDPQKDSYLRAWGTNGKPLGLPGDDPNSFSYSLLKWDLSGFPAKSRVATAELILTATPEAGYTAKDAEAAPLEVRNAKTTFTEGAWDYTDAPKYAPLGTDSEIFGSVSPSTVVPTEFKIVIDLMKGPNDFKAYFNEALKKGKTLALALTSRIDPSQLGMSGVYRVYSKDATDPTVRPQLRITLENPPK